MVEERGNARCGPVCSQSRTRLLDQLLSLQDEGNYPPYRRADAAISGETRALRAEIEQRVACGRVDQQRTSPRYDGRIVAETRRDVQDAIKKKVVKDVRLIVDACAAADDQIIIVPHVPGKSGRRAKVVCVAIRPTGQFLVKQTQ